MHTQREKDDFLKLLSENQGIIIKICNSFHRDKADREDLAQEIIYNLWKGGGSYNPDFKFSTWMYRVALNVAISSYRKEKKLKQTIVFSAKPLEMEDKIFSPPESEENSNLLQQHITELKELDKALMILYFEEKSYKEIAEIIGISETNVATKVSRIKEKLKQNIMNSKK
ncbi:MAG TPA: sigma-70 family RNA polymerase sigma factor [Puia sp.]|nr:sigma-70 family RNA polymerase sigma factor [Puia sp.]